MSAGSVQRGIEMSSSCDQTHVLRAVASRRSVSKIVFHAQVCICRMWQRVQLRQSRHGAEIITRSCIDKLVASTANLQTQKPPNPFPDPSQTTCG